jgi:polar amino acid transport system substrate-binding protein
MRKVACVLLAMCIISAAGLSTVWAQESLLDEIQKRGVIKVGMYLQYPPTEFRDSKTREPKGLEVDIANLLAKDLGVKIEIVDMEWDAIIPGLLAKKYDVIIASMSRTPKRNLSIAITSNNLEDYSTMALVRKDDPRSTVEEFNKKGVTVTCLMGGVVEVAAKKFFPNATLKPMQINAAVLEVESGRADIIIVENVFAYNYVREHPKKLKIIFENKPLVRAPSAIGLRKGDQIFLNWLDNWIQYQWDNAVIQPLIDKWIVKGKGLD